MRLKKMASAELLYVLASMTRPTHEVNAAELARIHRTQGFSKIAVHYVIERDGSVHTGRASDEPGCLAPGSNHRALQVCLIGGLSEALVPADTFTPQQRSALRALEKSLQLPVVFDRACICLQEFT
ncbi:hypothetical protein [Lysobacter sp. CA199]|uniref:hypothetical protein n=1 Tax=Lysobacter sp. CA199 TaxID=3455608 RepID=UPI003F8D3AC2